MMLYAIVAACLAIGVPVAAQHGAMQTITNEGECKAAGGFCTDRENCLLSTNVFQEGCGGTYDGCCILKTTVCSSKNGSFIAESECEGKTGYQATGLHLGNDSCCAPRMSGGGGGGGTGQGNGSGNGQSGEQGNGQGSGSGSGQRKGHGNGNGQGSGNAEEQGQGNANAAGLARLSYLMPVVIALVCSYRAVV